MSGSPNVERQFKEIAAYNLFYSAMTGRANPCLADLGWVLPFYFGELHDPYEQITTKPDFVLYDGTVCWCVEVKSGSNIEQRDIDQMSESNDLSIDGVENAFYDADVQGRTPYDGTVEQIDNCIIYHDINEEWMEKCRNEWANCRERLVDLEGETAILTQRHGGRLRKLAGEFKTPTLRSLFNEGVKLPQNPKEEILLTEQMEKETLAVAICDIWGDQVVGYEDPVTTNVNQVRDYFAPRFNISPEKANRTLYYLTVIGACDHVEDLNYQFARSNMREIMNIKNTVRDERVEEVLSRQNERDIPDEHQTTLDSAIPENSEAADGGEENDDADSEDSLT